MSVRAHGCCVIAMQGRRDRHWERYVFVPVLPGKVSKVQAKRFDAVPPFWPAQTDYPMNRLVKDLIRAATPSVGERSTGTMSKARTAKSGFLAGVLAEALEIESFLLVTDAHKVPRSIHSIGMQPGDHDGALHVAVKARTLFHDLPEDEHAALFEDIRQGRLLTDRERVGIVEGQEFGGWIDPDSHYAQTGRIRAYDVRPPAEPRRAIAQYTPQSPSDREKAGDDPGLSAALERLRLAVVSAA